MRCRADMEVIVGTRYLQLIEEDLRHVVVVVLPRVYDDFLYAVRKMVFDGAAQCGSLDDLGPCPYDGDEFHGCLVFQKVISPWSRKL